MTFMGTLGRTCPKAAFALSVPLLLQPSHQQPPPMQLLFAVMDHTAQPWQVLALHPCTTQLRRARGHMGARQDEGMVYAGAATSQGDMRKVRSKARGPAPASRAGPTQAWPDIGPNVTRQVSMWPVASHGVIRDCIEVLADYRSALRHLLELFVRALLLIALVLVGLSQTGQPARLLQYRRYNGVEGLQVSAGAQRQESKLIEFPTLTRQAKEKSGTPVTKSNKQRRQETTDSPRRRQAPPPPPHKAFGGGGTGGPWASQVRSPLGVPPWLAWQGRLC